jgi:hypothetical protein
VRDDPIERRRQARRRGLLVRLAVLCAACVLVCVGVSVVAVAVIRRPAEPSAKHVAQSPPPAVQSAKQLDPSAQPAPHQSKSEPIRYYLSVSYSDDPKAFPRRRGKSLTVLTSIDLGNEFQANELKAINTYRGQRFYISGEASALSVDGEVTTLAFGYAGFAAVYCKCSSRDSQLLKVRATPR